MRTEFIIDHDAGESSTVRDLYGALVGRIVDLEIPDNTGYPAEDVYVVRVDSDGDVVVCESDGRGPIETGTWAIPQEVIRRVRVSLGSFA